MEKKDETLSQTQINGSMRKQAVAEEHIAFIAFIKNLNLNMLTILLQQLGQANQKLTASKIILSQTK